VVFAALRHRPRAALFGLALVLGCGMERDESPAAASLTTAPLAADVVAIAEVPEPTPPGPCPADMALVAGSYCPAPSEECVAWQESVGEGGKLVKNQCKAYKSPARCLADHHEPLRYCMDRYEWPNQEGALPRTLTSWEEARALCGGVGKRLCSEAEWSFACEGEAMRPYVYGYERDASACNFDRPYRPRTFNFTRWDECQSDETCRGAFEAIDQRVPAGSSPRCVNEQGIFDLNGNVNEWVVRTDQKSPRRSGIKGGWWGPVRNRCGPTVGFHDEGDWGYEVGFRCCAEAAP
jgi:sulfatase modifying factor 1